MATENAEGGKRHALRLAPCFNPETAAEISEAVCWKRGYIEDPHTAVASAVYQKYRTQTGGCC